MGGVYAVASAKGGVGKTTTVAALGATLATAGYDVVAVDADLGAANLASTTGIEPDGATVHDVLAGAASVEEATYAGPAGLDVVPGATDLDSFRRADPTRLQSVVDALDDYEVVLLDTGAGLSHDTVAPLEVVDAVVLVSGTSEQSLGDADKSREVAERLGKRVAGVVFTRTTEAPAGADRLEVEVLATVPDDPVVSEALAGGTPVSTYAPTSDVAAAYRTLASALADAPVEWSDESADADRATDASPEADDESDSEATPEEASGDDGDADDRDAAADEEVTIVNADDRGATDGEADAAEDDAAEDETSPADAEASGGDEDPSGGEVHADESAEDDGAGDGETEAASDDGNGGKRQRGFLGRLFR